MLTTVLLKKPQTTPSQEVLDEAVSFQRYVTDVISKNLTVGTDPVGQNYCVAPSVTDSQIPFWIKQNYGTDSNENYLIDFLKSYYNWIYCGFKKEDVQLTPYDIEELLDIDRVPDAFLDEYIKSYAPFISLPSISATDKQYVRAFIRSIKSDFLITKGTEPAYRYLLKTLYNVTNVNIDYPKKYLMRLNGGKYVDFSWSLVPTDIIDLPENFDPNNPIQNDVLAGNVGYSSTRPNLFGAALNEAVLPDDYFWQEYSYILTSDATTEQAINYKNTLLAGTHPAGMLGFFEQYVPLDDVDTGADENDDGSIPVSYEELPVIGRYLLMFPGITSAPANSPVISIGTNLYSLYNQENLCDDQTNYTCYCCSNYCDPMGTTGYYPQHIWPAWDPGVRRDILTSTQKTLGNMTIGSFIELSYAVAGTPSPGQQSPNTNLLSCSTVGCAECT
jgi:hypothetical protein